MYEHDFFGEERRKRAVRDSAQSSIHLLLAGWQPSAALMSPIFIFIVVHFRSSSAKVLLFRLILGRIFHTVGG